ncbi:tetratricopeptide repeat protein [Tenacibaculum finnmarkense]|uniref:tetratricopeptide repeat protein n=1 Tax=Tenacibaculum finnmarkense TaxID=2781243 RepID=UPI0023005BA0|nr:tetratricopeptide repeat protein [Tenacibaculum finnmarkense]WCC46192.1 tetratricopeptide repeat protein [Tenacibaculum finnmarkense]
MKKLLFFIFISISISSNAQVNRYTNYTHPTYTKMSFKELAAPAMALKQKYDANQKYLYNLKEWILELRPQISEEQFLTRLNKEYKDLTDIEDRDLARATKYLKQTENAVKEIISDYNIWLNKQNTQNQSYTNSTTSNNSSQNYTQIGFEFQKNGKFVEAIYNYTKQLETDKNNTDILFLRAMCKTELNDRYGAINDYDKIIELEKTAKPTVYKMSTVYNNKAFCLVNLKNYEDALPLVNKALELDKTEAYIWDTRGELYYHIGEYEKSVNDMNKALKIQKNASSYYYRGLSYIKLDKKSKACSDFSKAGELGNSDAYEKITKNCN